MFPLTSWLTLCSVARCHPVFCVNMSDQRTSGPRRTDRCKRPASCRGSVSGSAPLPWPRAGRCGSNSNEPCNRMLCCSRLGDAASETPPPPLAEPRTQTACARLGVASHLCVGGQPQGEPPAVRLPPRVVTDGTARGWNGRRRCRRHQRRQRARADATSRTACDITGGPRRPRAQRHHREVWAAARTAAPLSPTCCAAARRARPCRFRRRAADPFSVSQPPPMPQWLPPTPRHRGRCACGRRSGSCRRRLRHRRRHCHRRPRRLRRRCHLRHALHSRRDP